MEFTSALEVLAEDSRKLYFDTIHRSANRMRKIGGKHRDARIKTWDQISNEIRLMGPSHKMVGKSNRVVGSEVTRHSSRLLAMNIEIR
jgi:hypothetical protein